MSGVGAMDESAGDLAVMEAGQPQLWTGVQEGSGMDWVVVLHSIEE